MQTVLVVEDERKLRELLRGYLERAGFAVLTTGSGAEAIELGRTADPALVVLDLGLPDIPGEEVARELRSTVQIPILMLTAIGVTPDTDPFGVGFDQVDGPIDPAGRALVGDGVAGTVDHIQHLFGVGQRHDQRRIPQMPL